MNYKTLVAATAIIHTAFLLEASVLTVTSLANSGPGTLRDQIAASSPGDTIQFAITGTIVLNASIPIGHTLFVSGPGVSALVVDANHIDRAFITGGNPVLISGLTIQNGLTTAPDAPDAGLGQNGLTGADAYGGAILDQGPALFVSNCWFVANVVRGGKGGQGGNNSPFAGNGSVGSGGAGGEAVGGAIYSTANVWIYNCTFSGNQAIGGSGGGGGTNTFLVGASGGTGGTGGTALAGATDAGTGGVALTNFTSTFSGNSAIGGAGGSGGDSVNGPGGSGGNSGSSFGGAISTLVAEFRSCTIVSNSASARNVGSGGSGLPPGSIGSIGNQFGGGISGYTIVCICTIGNTILADNFAGTGYTNYLIAFADSNYNFIGSQDWIACPFDPAKNFLGTIAAPIHPRLLPLAQNGGGLPTHEPLTNSPIIDAGYSFGIGSDERGAPRPYDFSSIPGPFAGGDGSDIGAFELGQPQLGLSKSGGSLALTWPAYYGNFTLQSTPNLLFPGGWGSITDAPVPIGNLLVVTNRPVGPANFYRLINH